MYFFLDAYPVDLFLLHEKSFSLQVSPCFVLLYTWTFIKTYDRIISQTVMSSCDDGNILIGGHDPNEEEDQKAEQDQRGHIAHEEPTAALLVENQLLNN